MGPRFIGNWWFGRKRKVKDADPPRTFVFAHSHQTFSHWCHVHGVNLNDPAVISISTATFEVHRIQGYHFRPKDVFVVLETAALGHGWHDLCQEVLQRSEGWVDLEERKEQHI
jgi:hypothetical protein